LQSLKNQLYGAFDELTKISQHNSDLSAENEEQTWMLEHIIEVKDHEILCLQAENEPFIKELQNAEARYGHEVCTALLLETGGLDLQVLDQPA
jgi:uncharacterized protein YgfB (UPF0149 family)